MTLVLALIIGLASGIGTVEFARLTDSPPQVQAQPAPSQAQR